MTKRAPLAIGAASLALAIPAVAGAAVSFFHSPSGNIECQMSSGGQLGKLVYCQTLKPAQSATLHTNGKTKVCRGQLCLGNGPENAFTLPYGHSVRIGPFRCHSSTSGIHCYLVSNGHGFVISNRGVKRS